MKGILPLAAFFKLVIKQAGLQGGDNFHTSLKATLKRWCKERKKQVDEGGDNPTGTGGTLEQQNDYDGALDEWRQYWEKYEASRDLPAAVEKQISRAEADRNAMKRILKRKRTIAVDSDDDEAPQSGLDTDTGAEKRGLFEDPSGSSSRGLPCIPIALSKADKTRAAETDKDEAKKAKKIEEKKAEKQRKQRLGDPDTHEELLKVLVQSTQQQAEAVAKAFAGGNDDVDKKLQSIQAQQEDIQSQLAAQQAAFSQQMQQLLQAVLPRANQSVFSTQNNPQNYDDPTASSYAYQ